MLPAVTHKAQILTLARKGHKGARGLCRAIGLARPELRKDNTQLWLRGHKYAYLAGERPTREPKQRQEEGKMNKEGS